MKKSSTLVALVAVLFAAPVFACDKDQAAHAKASGCRGKEAQTAAAKGGCHGESGAMAAKVMEKLPSMTYRVGDFNTPCAKTAAEKAGAEGTVQYVVDGTAFDCKGKATAALAALLEKEAADMMTVRYSVGDDAYGCPMAAKATAAAKKAEVTYHLAGLNFKSQEEADKVAKLVSDAVAKMSQPPAPTADAAPAAKSGCGAAKDAAATASATGGCSKAKAETASATGGCSKAKAETASATGGCSKGKADVEAATASGVGNGSPVTASLAGGCDKTKAQVASASGCCAKGKAASLAAAGGCDKAKAQVASAKGCCMGGKDAAAPVACCDEAEQRLASAKAKLQVIIETVLASSAS